MKALQAVIQSFNSIKMVRSKDLEVEIVAFPSPSHSSVSNYPLLNGFECLYSFFQNSAFTLKSDTLNLVHLRIDSTFCTVCHFGATTNVEKEPVCEIFRSIGKSGYSIFTADTVERFPRLSCTISACVVCITLTSNCTGPVC